MAGKEEDKRNRKEGIRRRIEKRTGGGEKGKKKKKRTGGGRRGERKGREKEGGKEKEDKREQEVKGKDKRKKKEKGDRQRGTHIPQGHSRDSRK